MKTIVASALNMPLKELASSLKSGRQETAIA